jgi:hypothetical protein
VNRAETIPAAPRGFRAPGMTLVEVMVTMVVLTSVFLTTMIVIRTSSDNMGFELTVADQQVITRAKVDELMDEFRCIRGSAADFNTLTGANADTASDPAVDGPPGTVTFLLPKFDDATQTVDYGTAGEAITYRWQLNARETDGNGIDDDGNGLTDDDDGLIVRLVGGDETTLRVVAGNVPKSGYWVRKIGRRLEVTLSRKNTTTRNTADGTGFTTTVTHVTYFLKND